MAASVNVLTASTRPWHLKCGYNHANGYRSMKLARSTPAAPSVADSSPSEHIYIGSDEARNPSTTARTVRGRAVLRNAVRRAVTTLTLYAEGFVGVAEESAAPPTCCDIAFRLTSLFHLPMVTVRG